MMSQAGYTHQEAMDKIVELEEKLRVITEERNHASSQFEKVCEAYVLKILDLQSQVKELTLINSNANKVFGVEIEGLHKIIENEYARGVEDSAKVAGKSPCSCNNCLTCAWH